MAKLQDILDYNLLQEHLKNGVVRRQVHPQYPELYILNYTEVAQYDRIWDSVTNVCRGLIVADDIVVARGFNKFHNLNTEYVPETMEANLPGDVPLVTEKLDGSMGILYYWDNQIWVATRGSFASDQAKWATAWLRERETENLRHYLTVGDDHTLVTEIIYPENRIVVDYDYAGLILTGCIEIETGKEVDRSVLEEIGEAIGIPAVKRFDKSLAECAGENETNAEGYVLTYPSTGLKVKVKFEEYVRLHRILTGLNPRAIWEMLVPPEMLVRQQVTDTTVAEKRRASVDSILADPKMPVGFIEWFGGWVNHLRSEYKRIESEALAVFNKRPAGLGGVDRKTLALYFKAAAPELASICFALLDGKDYEHIIWKQLKPRGDAETYKRDGE
jgi:RNA ligase